MPFGLYNAPAIFQRLMNKILRPYIGKFVEVYLDDVIIHSRSKEEHIKHVRAVFQKIRKANLKLKPTKCKWFEQELTFVGYKIEINSIRSDPRNIEKIKNVQVLSNTIQLRGFLGLAQYYRQYVKDYVDIAGPLYNMLKDNAPEYWGPAQQATFDNLKEKLTSEPIRIHPNFDKSFKLYTDASDTGLGAVLAQDDEESKERVITYDARRLNSAERVYPTTEKECLVIV